MHTEAAQITDTAFHPPDFISSPDGDRASLRGGARFLIVTQYFPPEIGGAPTRLQSVATELRQLGYEVEILTGFPNYPHGKFFAGYERGFYRREVRDGLTIHRVWMYPALGSGIQRMLNYGSFTMMTFLGLFRAKRPDYIFVESPPIFLSIPAFLAGIVWGTPFIFNVADMWPDVIVEGGFLKEGVLVKCMRAIEDWSYKKALYINAVTEGVRRDLLTKKSVPPEKILFLPNGADTVRFQPRPPDTLLKDSLGLTGKKVILWAGTLGLAHGLEHVLQAAKLLAKNGDIHFLFVGDGSAKKMLLQVRDDLQLGNVSFHDAVQLEQLPPYFSIADVGLASLIDLPLFEGARPSKLFPILASGKPLIFAGRGESARLVQEAHAGIVVPSADPEALASAVLELTRDAQLAQAYGQNGRDYVEAHLQWSQVIAEWLEHLSPLQKRTSLGQGSVQTRKGRTSFSPEAQACRQQPPQK